MSTEVAIAAMPDTGPGKYVVLRKMWSGWNGITIEITGPKGGHQGIIAIDFLAAEVLCHELKEMMGGG